MNTLTVSHSLDPDQDQLSVGPDLDTNCLQRSSVDDKSQLARNELKGSIFVLNFCSRLYKAQRK